jgi:hypothetical protein
MSLDVTYQLVIRCSGFVNTGEKLKDSNTVHQLFVDLEKAYDSVRREALYIFLKEPDVPMKLVCLSQKVHVDKHL